MGSRPLWLKLSQNIRNANHRTTLLAAADAGDDHGHELDGFIEGQRRGKCLANSAALNCLSTSRCLAHTTP